MPHPFAGYELEFVGDGNGATEAGMKENLAIINRALERSGSPIRYTLENDCEQYVLSSSHSEYTLSGPLQEMNGATTALIVHLTNIV